MHKRTWDMIDREATREARALRKARLHRTTRSRSGSNGLMGREQAIWDEHLEIHFTSCSFCGRALDEEKDEHGNKQLVSGARVSLFTKDIDICNQCLYLHNQLGRSCPVRSMAD